MKYLIIILLLVTSLTTKAQDTIKIPYPIAKQIAKDLVVCDSAIATLVLVTQQLSLTEQKVVFKDSVISNHVNKGLMYKTIITNQDQKFELQGKWITDLEKKNRSLRAKLTFTQIISTIFVGLITYIYVAK